MAIRTLFTRGYGNGTFDGSIASVVLRGYAVAAVVELVVVLAETQGDKGFVRVRFIHFGVAHAFVLVVTEARGHLIAIGAVHAAIAPILEAAGYRPVLYRVYGKAQVMTVVESQASGQVVVIDDAEVMEILWLLGQH